MVGVSISCNLEAITVAGYGRFNIDQCKFNNNNNNNNKSVALGWNPFQFCGHFGFPQQKIIWKRKLYGACKLNMQCINRKTNMDKTSSGYRKWRFEEMSVAEILSEKAIEMLEALKTLQKPAMIAILVGLLLFHDPGAALAAKSGGRMGGNSFSSGRGSGGYSSRAFSASPPSFSFSVPYAAPSPFGFGGGLFVRPTYGIGFGVGSGLFTLVLAFLAVFLVAGFLSDRADSGLFVSAQKTSVLKLQIGLLGMARSLQRELDRIAETADTSSPEGLSYVLKETALALLRHPDYCISGYSLSDIKRSMEAGEEHFNQLSIEERGKFDEETLVNVNSMWKRQQSTTKQRSDAFANEYIVVTIIVAAEGQHKLPAVKSSTDLREALKKLGSIPSHQTLAVEVLWTPQNEYDTLNERELLQDYPLLRPL